MTHFKNLKSGFSFIEIIISLLLLSIFGTTLFMSQASINAAVYKTHQKIINILEIDKLHPELKLKLFEQKNKDMSNQSIEINKTSNDGRAFDIKVLPISEDSSLKSFSQHLKIVRESSEKDGKIDSFSTIIFTEKPKDKKEGESK